MCIFSLYFNQRVPASKACDSYYLLARPFEITTISMISSCIYIHVRLLGYLQMHSILMTSEFMMHNWNNVALLCDFADFAASCQHPSDHRGPGCLLWFPTVPASSLKLYRNSGLRWPSRLYGASELRPDIHRAAFCVRLEQSFSLSDLQNVTANQLLILCEKFLRGLQEPLNRRDFLLLSNLRHVIVLTCYRRDLIMKSIFH